MSTRQRQSNANDLLEEPGAAKAPSSPLQRELNKRGKFDSAEQEAFLNLVRTQAILIGDAERFFKPFGVSMATYNVLRILRGHHPKLRTCSQVGADLVAQVPDVTRLIDRLEELGLATRERTREDRRVVLVGISQSGLALLEQLDPLVLDFHRQQLGHMTEASLSHLSTLLAEARLPAAQSGRCESERHAASDATPQTLGAK